MINEPDVPSEGIGNRSPLGLPTLEEILKALGSLAVLFNTSAAPPVAPAPPAQEGTFEEKTAQQAAYGVLRSIRADAQDLLRSLEDLQTQTALVDDLARASEIQTLFKDLMHLHNDARVSKVSAHLLKLRAIVESFPGIANWASDEICGIENLWIRVCYALENLACIQPQPGADAIMASCPRVVGLLHEIIYRAEVLTVPDRINQHLSSLRTGQALNFGAVFADELPFSERREEVLQFIAAHPGTVNGIVDVGKGVIYRASPRPWVRRLAIVYLLLGLAAGLGVVAVMSFFSSIPALNKVGGALPRWRTLGIGYGSVIAGSAAHFVIDLVKRSRRGEPAPAMEDLVMWLHVRLSTNLVGVATLLAGFIGAVAVFKRADTGTMFLVGYSIDSFVDLFLGRFDKAVTAGVSALKTIT